MYMYIASFCLCNYEVNTGNFHDHKLDYSVIAKVLLNLKVCIMGHFISLHPVYYNRVCTNSEIMQPTWSSADLKKSEK